MRLHVRYNTPDENGETRNDRNARFRRPPGEDYADYIPEECEHLWVWYFDISNRMRRVRDGGVEPIPPTEWIAWLKLTGNRVYAWEHRVLAAMDLAFCSEMGKELDAYRARLQDEAAPTKRK